MNKAALIDAVASKTGHSKKDVEMMLEAMLDIITNTLQGGDEVTLTGFGTFRVSKRSARAGINPLTKEKIQIPEVTVPKFKAGKALKDAVRK
jgi:DNA-binding protein HU-beta